MNSGCPATTPSAAPYKKPLRIYREEGFTDDLSGFGTLSARRALRRRMHKAGAISNPTLRR